jgi:hypothetical protein
LIINTYDVSIKKNTIVFIIIYLQPLCFQENKGILGMVNLCQLLTLRRKHCNLSESYLNAKKRYSNKKTVHSAGLNIQQIGNYNDLNIKMRGEYRVDIIQKG